MHSRFSRGFRTLEVHDPVQDSPIPSWVLYPSRAPEQVERFGPYQLELAADAPIAGSSLPVIAISHGNGGTPWTHRGTAGFLARSGFVVLLLEHPGNSRSDNSLAFTAGNLENRPRHVQLALDAVFRDTLLAPRLADSGVGLIGHSIGAYTALALAGGRPRSFPREEPGRAAREIPVIHDSRVRALALLAPATAWYMAEGALKDVTAPILMRAAEHDPFAPSFHAELVCHGVADPARVDHQVVPNAGHFSFQSPFPASMNRPDFPPSCDPDGFDRAAYLPRLNGELLQFFRASLTGSSLGPKPR